MPENKKPFKQLKEDVREACWEGQDYDFAALEGKLPAKKVEELQRTCQLEKLKRAAYEAGRLGEEIDRSSLEQEWNPKEINSLWRMHERGKEHPPGPGEKRPRGHGEDRDNFDQTRYELGEKIGAGAFGTVYEGLDLDPKPKWTDRNRVAIKIQRSLWKKMSKDEARRLRQVRSRYVVEVLDYGLLIKPDGNPELLSRFQDELELMGCPQLNTEDRDRRIYLVMELIEGEHLGKKIKPEKPFDEDQTRQWMYECCRGMYEAHEAGLIHRDLKPENIFIESVSKSVKIGDFGLAKLIPTDDLPAEESISEDVAKENPATAGTFKYFGTFEYMAPEHWDGNAEKRSDIYSFGATFYHLLTGQPPFTGDQSTLRRKHKEEIPPSPKSLHPKLSVQISDLIMKCLEKEPGDRYQSFQSIQNHLQTLPDLIEKIKCGYDALKEGDCQTARGFFSKATGMCEDSAEAWCGLGEAYLMDGELKRAINAFTKAIELKDDFDRAHEHLKIARENLSRQDKGSPPIDDGLSWFLQEGERSLNKGDFVRAYRAFNKAIAKYPHSYEARIGRGKTYLLSETNDQAIKDFTAAISLNQYSPEAYYLRGKAYLLENQHDKAIKDFTKTLELEPRYPEALLRRGRAYFERKHWRAEFGHVQKLKRKDYDLAIKDLSLEISQINPGSADAYYYRGLAYLKRKRRWRGKDLSLAVEDFKKVVELNPDHCMAWFNLGRAEAMRIKKYEPSIRYFSKALALDPKMNMAYFNRGLAYWENNDDENAEIDFQVAGKEYAHLIPKRDGPEKLHFSLKKIESFIPPPYEAEIMEAFPAVIPSGVTTKVIADRGELVSAVQSASLVTDKENQRVIFRFKGKEVELESKGSDISESKIRFGVEMEGEEVELGFDPAFFVDALSTIATEQVTLVFYWPEDSAK